MAILSTRVRDLHASPVRAMLAASQQPHMISFAGGLPAPDSFDDLELAAPPREALQYGPTEGEPALRDAIAEELAAIGLDVPAERVMVLSGSQQGIDLAAKLLIDPGARLAVQAPTYLAALQVFRFFGARFETLREGWSAGDAPVAAYINPTFQNPTGACWTLDERQALAAACDGGGVTLFEDDPYRDLAYGPCERRPVASLVRSASWIYQGSFSKTVAPGLRVGFLAASEDLFPYLVRLKQAADLHPSRVGQWMVLQHLQSVGRAARLDRLVTRYKAKRDGFEAAMRRHMGNLAQWETPDGGLFFWARLPGIDDSRGLVDAAIARGVLFTPGEHFFADPDSAGAAAIRLNFSHADPERAERGLATLAEVIAEAQAATPSAISRSISAGA